MSDGRRSKSPSKTNSWRQSLSVRAAALPAIDGTCSTLPHTSLGSAQLALYTKTGGECHLLAANDIAQSLPMQALSDLKTPVRGLESFLEKLHSALCLQAVHAAQPVPERAGDISCLRLLLRPAENDTRGDFLAVRALKLKRLVDSLGVESSIGSSLLLEVIILRRHLLKLATSDKRRHNQRVILASLLRTYWECTEESDFAMLHEEISLRRQILQDHGDYDSDRAIACHSLAVSLDDLYQSTGDLSLLEEALELERKALHLRPRGHRDRARSCENLATSLKTLFDQTEDTMMLHEALELQRETLALRPKGHPHRAYSCTNLAASLWTCFNQMGDTALLEEALELEREALHLRPGTHPDRADSCGNLALSLKTRFKQTGDTTLLDEALELEREALHLRPEGHPDRADSCTNLAVSLWIRFNKTGDEALLEEALELEREALYLRPEGDPNRADSCGNLAISLKTRFTQTGDIALLDNALELEREVLHLRPEGHRDRADSCGNLAFSLWTRFNQTGDTRLLGEALELQREAFRLRPEGDANRAHSCASLALLLKARFDQTGDTALLNEALELEREALHLRPEGHPDRADSCASLAILLRTRWNQTGDTTLLEEALELEREVLQLRPKGHPNRANSCANLAVSLWSCYDETGDRAILDEALKLQREALCLTPEGHPDRADSCTNLAISLWTCCNQTGDGALLEEALDLEREAWRLRPERHSDHAQLCGNLASSLRTRFNQTGDTVLLDEARLLCTHAIAKSEMSPSIHVWLKVQLARIHSIPSYSSYNPSAAVTFLLEALQHRAGLIENFHLINDALRICVKVAISDEDNVQLLAVYQVIIDMLPELGNVILDKVLRLRRWRDAGDLPLEAFLLALKTNSIPLGLELLEQGRAVLWSQTLAIRDPQLEVLPDVWKSQMKTLLRCMSSSAEYSTAPKADLTPRDWIHASYTQLQLLLGEIRAHPGLEGFMRGISYPQLAQTASTHPVVLLATEDTACHAIIISPSSDMPVHLKLNGIASPDIEHLGHDIRGLDLNVRAMSTPAATVDERGMAINGRREDPSVRKLHRALARLWVGIIKPILDTLGLKVRGLTLT
jgi:DNA-binding protein H-NS